jgi:hypothetical protein
MHPALGGDGVRAINKFQDGMFVIVDLDSPKPNTFPVEYKELAASAYTANQAWKNYEQQKSEK